MKFVKIDGENVERVLSNVSRQYLVGNLQKPQEIEFVRDENLEIGITDYNTYTIEKPHKHTKTYEYQYMLDGYTEYMDVDTGEIISFKKGDFFLIPTNVAYAQKSSQGTRILFIKVPSLNDKEVLPESDEVKNWYEKRI